MPNKGKHSTVKRTVKYLAVAPNEVALRTAIKTAPDSVIKSLSDVALNAAKGNIHIPPAQKKKLARNRKAILTLTKKNVSIRRKRRILTQKGGFAWIPALVGSVLGLLGGRIFDKKASQ
jgi:hypothetical protein